MINLLRKSSKIFTLLFNPALVGVNLILFTCYYVFLGPKFAINFFEKVSKTSVIPILRLFGAKVGKNCDIEPGLIFHNCNDFSNLEIGDNCHIGKKCFFDLRGQIIIENNVVISMQTTLVTHIDLTNSDLNKYFPSKNENIYIKNNSYIGAKSLILKGVTINENTFVAANALVNKDTESMYIYSGIPAKKLRTIE